MTNKLITINGQFVDNIPLSSETQINIYRALKQSPTLYYYQSIYQLKFELLLREKIIETSILLSKSEAIFTDFSNSKFHSTYWIKTRKGYVLRPNVLPSLAVRDVWINSKEYSFECSTAIILIYYYAVLQVIQEQAFNHLFRNLLVWNWSYDEDLGIITQAGTDFIPGDVLYFYNPDYKNPVWIGENAVYLGKDSFFGHGIGVKTADGMIEALNSLRKPNAKRSAHLLSQYSRLNFKYLAQFSKRL